MLSITLSPDHTKLAIASLQRFADTELEIELSDIQVRQLLQYILQEIAPSVRNQAIADTQAFLRERLDDMEATLYEPEFVHWPKRSSARGH
ncbi:MAG TPA: DUF2164 domain-containing protein [Gemmatimonadales bacterium]|nr:DUF2164 domain-containing protein [Gemmatimonadales bacterium]